jgi:hypothetical protein
MGYFFQGKVLIIINHKFKNSKNEKSTFCIRYRCSFRSL